MRVLHAILAMLCLAQPAPADEATSSHSSALRTLLTALAAAPPGKHVDLLDALAIWLAPPAGAPQGSETPIAALAILGGEVDNGGFSQYFSNSSGDGWKSARDALEAIADPEGQRIVVEAIARFGEAGPPTDRAERQARMKTLSDQDYAAWNALDQRWYRHAHGLQLAVRRWFAFTGPQLALSGKPTRPHTFQADCLLTPAAGEQWGEVLLAALRADPRCRLAGSMSSDLAPERLVEDCLSEPRDALQVIIIPSSDANLGAYLSLLAPLAEATSIQCVIVGAMPAGVPALPREWCLLLPGAQAGDVQALLQALDRRLAATTGR